MKIMKPVLIAIAVTMSASAIAADAVSFRLNWYIVGLHAPFLYGKERGFYKDEGIDLTINEGRGSISTAQVVAAGTDQFGFADSSSVVMVAAKGGEIRSVMLLCGAPDIQALRSVPRLVFSPLREWMELVP